MRVEHHKNTEYFYYEQLQRLIAVTISLHIVITGNGLNY